MKRTNHHYYKLATLALFALSTLTTSCDDKPKPHDYNAVEVKPQFDGGTAGIDRFLAENATTDFTEHRTLAKTSVEFTVSKSGEVHSPRAVGDSTSEYAAEAVRLVKSMPRWEPGKQGGQAVDVRMRLPISFLGNRYISADSLDVRSTKATRMFIETADHVFTQLQSGKPLTKAQLAKAATAMKGVLDIYPAHDNACRFLAHVYLTDKQYEQALAAIDQYGQTAGHYSYMASVYRGYAYDEQGMTAQADTEYGKAIKQIDSMRDINGIDICNKAAVVGYLEGTDAKRKVLEKALSNKALSADHDMIKDALKTMKPVNRKKEVHEEGCLVARKVK